MKITYLMKKSVALLLCIFLFSGCGSAGSPVGTSTIAVSTQPGQNQHTMVSLVGISFDYNKTSTHASNQIAVWVEDAKGELVTTLFVTNFTAGRRGYEARPDTLKEWVAKAAPSDMTDAEIDTLSRATPASGTLYFTWDLKDPDGERVQDGTYYIKAEATLLWTSYVLYTAEIDTGTAMPGEAEITEYRSDPGNEENAGMIQNVRIVFQ